MSRLARCDALGAHRAAGHVAGVQFEGARGGGRARGGLEDLRGFAIADGMLWSQATRLRTKSPPGRAQLQRAGMSTGGGCAPRARAPPRAPLA